MQPEKINLINKISAIKFLSNEQKAKLKLLIFNMDAKEIKSLQKEISFLQPGNIKDTIKKLATARKHYEKEQEKLFVELQKIIDKSLGKIRKEAEAKAIEKIREDLKRKR